MEDHHRLRIQENITALIKGVNLNGLFRLLIQEGIILTDDVESLWERFPDRNARACEFYMWYTKRGPTAFEALTKSLRTLGNDLEADMLEATCAGGTASNRDLDEQRESRPRNEEASEFNNIRSSPAPEPSVHVYPYGEFARLDVQVKLAKLYNNGQVKHTYPMMSKPRGFALIVNNIHFKHPAFEYREGAEADTINMLSLLEQLGFEVTLLQNLDMNEFLVELKSFKEKFTRTSVDACIVSIMSHGWENVIDMCDASHATVNIWDDVVTPFNSRNCRALIGKPKIFFIQCCRGDLRDCGIPTTEPGCSSLSIGSQQTDAGGQSGESPLQPGREPLFKDILLCYATIPGHVAHRETVTGTWYIRTLCEVFMNHAHNTELKQLLDKVGRRMEKKVDSENLQTPSYKSIGFNRDLYFNPGLYADTSHLPD